MKAVKYFLPPLAFGIVLGPGVYFALSEYGPGAHGNTGALVIAVAASSIVATIGFIWTAFKVELFRRRR
ncbi:MAG TPA: hypothetical protein VEH76_14645 [Methylocystis sp.]|nr:hypothetical protein [Methylocystis sp.]